MEVRLSKGAVNQIRKSTEYYVEISNALGEGFIKTVEHSIKEIIAFPESSRIIKKPFRRYLMKKFPFGIVYCIEKNSILIITIMHLKQEPLSWLKNINNFKL